MQVNLQRFFSWLSFTLNSHIDIDIDEIDLVSNSLGFLHLPTSKMSGLIEKAGSFGPR